MPHLALKVDVDTLRGTLRGVPALVALFRRHGVRATFLFSLGPDHTGRAIKRAFRPGFLRKVKRTSVLSHYGLLTLMYGTVLPGPDIGRRCPEILRATRECGHEVGIHCWDHIRWQDGVGKADAAWTEKEMNRADRRFEEIFGEKATCHGAAGWQMNPHALRQTQRRGYAWASDCRGSEPFVPVWNGELVHCPQLPTTLPTLDELIGTQGLNAGNVHEHLLAATAEPPEHGHVFTLHAELEGMKLSAVLDRLMEGWKAQGYTLGTVGDLRDTLHLDQLPRYEMGPGEIPGRSGTLMVQGEEFLQAWKEIR